MSEDEAKVQSSSEEEATDTPKKGRGRPKKADTPASGEHHGTPVVPAPAGQSDIIFERPPPCAAAEEDSFHLHHTGGRDKQEEEVLHFPERISPPIVVPLTPTPIAAQETEDVLHQQQDHPPLEPPSECEFKVPPLPPLVASPISTGSPSSDLFADTVAFPDRQEQSQFLVDVQNDDDDSEFQPAQNFQFAASDFDFLLTKGGGNDQVVETPRDSLLLKFDPLLKAAPLVASSGRLSVTREEEPEEEQEIDEPELVAIEGGGIEISNNPPVIIETAPAAEDGVGESPDRHQQHHQQQEQKQIQQPQQYHQQPQFVVGEGGVLVAGLETSGFIAAAVVVAPSPASTAFCASTTMNIDEEAKNLQPHCADDEEADEKMSVDNTMILDGESSTADRNMSYMEPDQDFNNGTDKKSKNESLKIEELQKKLSEAELREEALLKRITDKDKAISKMSGVVEAYERTIADLITQKEQTTQSYEKTCEALKADSDINAQHLESLEKTFSDLHAKYERMKVMTAEYKEREEELVNERNRSEESLRMQEKRYENMKSHAMTQLEIANNKLSELVRNHAQEVTKLKALLKKEEIYRASVNEQLSQKTRENEELVKICEELINGGAN